MFFLWTIYPLIPQFENEVYHLNIFNLGILGTMTFAGWFFFSFLLGRIGDTISQMKALTIALFLSGLSFVAILAFHSLTLLVLASFFSGASYTVLYLAPGIIATAATTQSMTKWVSISQSSVCFASCIGALISGRIYEVWIYLPFLIAIAALTTLAIITMKISAC